MEFCRPMCCLVVNTASASKTCRMSFDPRTPRGDEIVSSDITWVPAPVFLARHKHLFSKNTFYAEIKRGGIPHVTVGKKIFCPENALALMLEGGERGQELNTRNAPTGWSRRRASEG